MILNSKLLLIVSTIYSLNYSGIFASDLLEDLLTKRSRLSVVIPAYNEELWIERTVKGVTDSCKEANLKDFEVLVINDASTDATAAIASNSGARVINVQNRNIGKNRNQGAKEAKYDYILFIDADSIVSGRDIERGLALLDKGTPFVTTFARYDNHFPFIANLWCNLSNLCISHLGWHGTAGGGTIFTDKKTFEKLGGFDSTLFSTEDIDLIRRSKHRAFIHTDGYTSSRRYVKNGIFSGVFEWLTDRNFTASDVWYKPNFRKTALLEGEIFQPISRWEHLFRFICPEVIHKQK